MLKINQDELIQVANFINKLTGIVLNQSNSDLMESRLGPLAEEFGCGNYGELLQKSNSDSSQTVQNRIIDAITTQETFFFRDNNPFELLRLKILPDLFKRMMAPGNKEKKLKIWSAACSTGQEVYSIAIILRELLPDMDRWNIQILGTDISNAAIDQASSGQYNRTEMSRGLTPNQVSKYFHNRDNHWRIVDELRTMAQFKQKNLQEPFDAMEKFDLILCRNVAIYFSPENRRTMYKRIANQLNPNGFLIIGASESLNGASDQFEHKDYMRSVFYQLKG